MQIPAGTQPASASNSPVCRRCRRGGNGQVPWRVCASSAGFLAGRSRPACAKARTNDVAVRAESPMPPRGRQQHVQQRNKSDPAKDARGSLLPLIGPRTRRVCPAGARPARRAAAQIEAQRLCRWRGRRMKASSVNHQSSPAAAVTRRRRRLTAASGRLPDRKPDMEMVIVAPPRPNLIHGVWPGSWYSA
jgi:hypothetical protein